MVKRHTKPSQNNPGGIISKEAAINVSNVAYCKDCKATKIGYKTVDGKKVRFARKSGDVID
jgi:large subunit ribosomal protein L24